MIYFNYSYLLHVPNILCSSLGRPYCPWSLICYVIHVFVQAVCHVEVSSTSFNLMDCLLFHTPHPTKTTQTQVERVEFVGMENKIFHCRREFERAARFNLPLCRQITHHFMMQCVQHSAQCNIVPFHYTCPLDQCLLLVSCNLLVYCRVRMVCSSTKERTALQLADCL